MSAARPKVFISSAQGGLIAYRAILVEVCERHGLEPVYMEDLQPERSSPSEWSVGRVTECAGYIVLVGKRYGTLFADTGKSYTELEYETALGIPEMEVQVWLMKSEHGMPDSDVDYDPDMRGRLMRFRERLAASHVVREFGPLDDFRNLISPAVESLALKLKSGAMASETSLIRQVRRARAVTAPTVLAKPAYTGNFRFTGRRRHTRWLDEWSDSPDSVAVVEAIGGTGKSALTWDWFERHNDFDGRVWWSFYDAANTMEKWQRTFLSYTAGYTADEVDALDGPSLEDAVIASLEQRRYLVVYDGFERLLRAYLDFDGGAVSDSQADQQGDLGGRQVIDQAIYHFMRRLTSVRSSKILISTRLMPDAFEGFAGELIPGVAHLKLPGLDSDDTLKLLDRLNITYQPTEARDFFNRLDNHPLLIGIVIGIVRTDYRPAPSNLSAWLADDSAGGAFNVSDLPLTERRHDILEHALQGLDDDSLELLQRLSLLIDAVPWETVVDINPFRPVLPPLPEEWAQLPKWISDHLGGRRNEILERERGLDPGRPGRLLDATLKNLEDRGLLWWDRQANTYDLHPVVRSYAKDTMDERERKSTYATLVRDHFGAPSSSKRVREKAPTATSVADYIPAIREFYIYTGMGGAGLSWAADLWRRELSNPLVWDMGEHRHALSLLRAFFAADTRNVVDTLMVWDLATVEDNIGEHRVSLARWLGLIHAEMTGGAPAVKILSALNNASCSAENLRLSCFDSFLVESIRVLTEASGNREGDLARLDLYDGFEFLGRHEYGAALEAAESLIASGRRNPYDSCWDASVEQLRLRALLGLGRMVDIGPVDYTQHRFGERAGPLEMWFAFVVEYGYETGDYRQSLAAAQEIDRLQRAAGVETAPAGIALALARLGQLDEARISLESAEASRHRIEPAVFPHEDSARAWQLVGDHDRAREHAYAAYTQVWADGPETHNPVKVGEIAELLRDLGVDRPVLPSTSTFDVGFALREAVADYIAGVRDGIIPVE